MLAPQQQRQRPASAHAQRSNHSDTGDDAAARPAAPNGLAAGAGVGSALLPSHSLTAPGPRSILRPSTAPHTAAPTAGASASASAAAAAAASASPADPSLLPRCRMARAVPLDAIIHNLPSLLATPPGLGRRALLLKKLRLCSHMLDMGPAGAARHARLPPREQEAEARARETKRLTLLELVNYYTLARPVWTSEEMGAVFDMLAWNLFRPLPPSSFELHRWGGSVPGGAGGGAGGYTFSPEEDQQQEDANWTHVQIAYELLLRLVSATPTAATQQAIAAAAANPPKDNPHPEPVPSVQQLQTCHKLLYGTFLSRRFILLLLSNFSSEDSRERDYLKTLLHRIYGQSMSLRPFIRRNIHNILCRLIYEDERQHGISELLEILGSVINGFAVPLKPVHVDTLLQRVLMPLHKLAHLSLFHPQLSYCVMQFLEKDASLGDVVVRALLRYWPRQNSKKEVLLLGELEEALERLPGLVPRAAPVPHADDALSLDTLTALFERIASCLFSTHFQVSEKAIYLLQTDCLRKFVFFAGGTSSATGAQPPDYRAALVPIIARAVHINTEVPIFNSLERGTPSLRRPASAGLGGAASTAAANAAAKSIRPASAAAAAATPSDPLLADTPRGAASAPPSASSVKGHWNATIAELTGDVARVLNEIDAPLWAKCQRQAQTDYQTALRRAEAEGRTLHGAGDKLAAAVKAVSATATVSSAQQPRKAWNAK